MSNLSTTTSFLNNQYSELRKQIASNHAFSRFTSNPNYVKPEMPQGYLLDSRNLLSDGVIAVKDSANDAVELTKALATGKSCDNSLGRMNDLGLKLGGLGIAAYLASRKGTKTKGIMEFLGFGTFFATMALWPRLMIAKPLEKRFGFDIRQKYVDSQGRKKLFFQDNQYQPWDLWSNEKIDEIGDKMGVEKNVPERRELIKQKMRAVALQGNTLWMLSAGFSPVFTSLACNLMERGVTAGVINSQYAKAMKTAENMDGAVEAILKDGAFNAQTKKEFSQLLKKYKGVEPDENFYMEAARLLDPLRVIEEAKDVDCANLTDGMVSTRAQIAQSLKEARKAFKANDDSVVGLDVLKQKVSAFKVMDPATCKTFGLDDVLASLDGIADVKQVNGAEVKEIGVKTVLDKVDELVENKMVAKSLKAKISKALEGVAQPKGTPDAFYDSVQEFFDVTSRELSARTKTIGQTLNSVAGQKYESVYTNIHLKSVEEFMSQLKPTTAQLNAARKDPKASFKYLTSALGEKVQDESAYKSFINSLLEKQASFEAKGISKVLDKVSDFSKSTFDGIFGTFAADGAKRHPKTNELIEKLSDMFASKGGDPAKTPFGRVLGGFIEEKTAGIKSTNHRIIMAADLERRISTGTLKQQWKELGGDMSRFDAVCDIARKIVYNATMNDIANKQYLTGNGFEAKKIFDLVFLKDMDKSTATEGIQKFALDSVEKARKGIFAVYNSVEDLARQGHKLSGAITTDAVQKTQYAMIGKPLSELFMESASKKFNDRRWMKMFGGLAVVVAAGTLFAQKFFGKVQDEDCYKKPQINGGAKNVK